MKHKIETTYGELTYNDYNGKVTKRTGSHMGTVKNGKVTWGFTGMKWLAEEVEAAVAKIGNRTSPRTYVQDGYNGTAADHARGFDGIE